MCLISALDLYRTEKIDIALLLNLLEKALNHTKAREAKVGDKSTTRKDARYKSDCGYFGRHRGRNCFQACIAATNDGGHKTRSYVSAISA